jgi:hypothetical protein
MCAHHQIFFLLQARDQGEIHITVFNRALDGGAETMQLEPKNVRSNAAIGGRDMIYGSSIVYVL